MTVKRLELTVKRTVSPELTVKRADRLVVQITKHNFGTVLIDYGYLFFKYLKINS